jgi:hypothetical protein
MPAIISDKFRIFNATQFVESLTEGTTMGSGGDPELGDERTRLYFFVGRPQRWDAYLEIYSPNATAFNVGDEVYVGASFGAATYKAVVRQVFTHSLLVYNVNGSSGVVSVPAAGSVLKGYSGGSDTGAQAYTGVYRYATDEAAPLPVDNQEEQYSVYDDIIAAKRITNEYVRTVIRRYNWQTNTTYDMWRPDYFSTQTGRLGTQSATGASTIADAKYYVMNQQYQVWLCLFNGTDWANQSGQQSTEEPSLTPSAGTYDAATGIYEESGGVYKWKYMYTMSTDDVLRFLSTDFLPIVLPSDPSRAGVISNQVVVGAIDSYIVADNGANITASNGTYYAPVLGDGTTQAVAEITISGGSITSARVAERGEGYTYGSIAIATGTGTGATAYGLFDDVALTSAATVNAGATGKIEVIIPPKEGHGGNMELELNGKRVMTNIRLSYDEGYGDFPVDNDFRRIGLVRDPYVRGTTTYATNDTLNGLIGIRINGSTADYYVDEVVTQDLGGGNTAIGTVVSWVPDAAGSPDGILKIFQSVDYHQDNGVVRAFDPSVAAAVNGLTSLADGTIDNTYNQTSSNALFGTFVSGISNPEIEQNSGEVIYIENRRLITRAADQIEDIKLVIEF